MANTYDVGNLVHCYGAFKNCDAEGIDPSNVYFKFKEPSGEITTYTYGTDAALVRDSIGDYHVDVDVDEAGTWYYRFYSTGTGQAAAESNFVVRASEF